MKKKLIHCNSRSSATVSTKRLHCGRVAGKDIYTDFMVIENTCHMVFDSVMNGMLYPKEACMELANHLMATNKRVPAPLSHPSDADGNFLSASDPITFSAHNVFAFDTDWRIVGDKLVSNTYIDMKRAAENPEAQWLIERTNGKQPIDRSTGLELMVREEDGFGPDGEPYNLVCHSIVNLDHSAILDPDREPGAKNNAEAVGMFTNAQGDSIDVVEVEIAANASTPAMRLPIAPRDTNWDGAAAEGRIREYTGSTEAPSSNYRKFFMYFDQANADQFTAYKLPFADIINGNPYVIPAAISAIQGALSGARGGVDIHDADKQRIQEFVTAYQSRIEREQATMANTSNASNTNGTNSGRNANADHQEGGIASIINKIIEVFGFKPKAGYNADVLINNNEADQMKEKIIAALSAAGVQTDGLSDDALMEAYAKRCGASDANNGCDTTPAQDKAMVDNAKLLEAINALTAKVESVELAANAAAKTEIDAMAEQVAGLNIGLTANAAKLLPKAELESILAKNGVIVANSFGGQRQGGSQYEAMPE